MSCQEFVAKQTSQGKTRIKGLLSANPAALYLHKELQKARIVDKHIESWNTRLLLSDHGSYSFHPNEATVGCAECAHRSISI